MRKVILTLIGVFLASRLQAARPLPVGPLPESVYVDTEVSTNVAFELDSQTQNAGLSVRRDLAVNWRGVAPTWNLIRVTRRGAAGPSTAATVTIENKKFVLILW